VKKIKSTITTLVIDIDTLLDERDKIPLDGAAAGADAVQKKYRNQNATEKKLNELKSEIDKLATEIKSFEKNKGKNKLNYNIPNLKEQLDSFGEQYEERRVIYI